MSSSSSPARQKTVAAAAAAGKTTEGGEAPTEGEAIASETIQVAPDLTNVVDAARLEREKIATDKAAETARAKAAASEERKSKELAAKEAAEMAELERATRPSSSTDEGQAPAEATVAPESVTTGISEFMENPLVAAALERRRSIASVLDGLPKRGATLRCDNFEQGLAVLGKVELVEPNAGDGGQVLVWIEAVGHHWPIDGAKITGSRWTHDPTRYPLRGEDEEFDSKFRTKLALHSHEPPVVVEKFKAPRKARQGHAWARAIQPLGAHGFSIDDKPIKNWGPGTDHQIGEFNLNTLAQPGLFEKL